MTNIIIFIILYFLAMAINAKMIDELQKDKENKPVITDLNSVQKIFNTSPATANIKQCFYNSKTICKIRIRERMPAVIKTDQEIQTIVLGDSNNFEAKIIDKSKKLLRVKAFIPGSDTNLILVDSNGNLISFYIRVDSVDSDIASDFVVNITNINKHRKIQEKSINLDSPIQKAAKKLNPYPYFRKPLVKVNDIDATYVVDGDNAVKPISIYDDGVWTYFKYSLYDLSDATILPVVYQVVDGYDTPVNTRILGGSLVAESISKKWTIRAGDEHACVRKK